jgi:hypothetical protein
MKRIVCTGALVALLINSPAHAQQLTPVYGWLRTALENSMAQVMPPYGKADQTAKTASADNTDRSTSTPQTGQDNPASTKANQAAGGD